jgi:hypothetical protein
MLVMAQERRSTLVDALESCGIEVLPVRDCNEARRMLEAYPLVQVVVTDTTLPDGDWQRVLEIVEQGRRAQLPELPRRDDISRQAVHLGRKLIFSGERALRDFVFHIEPHALRGGLFTSGELGPDANAHHSLVYASRRSMGRATGKIAER